MSKKKEKFVRCGFEFTAAKRPDTYLDESIFSNKLNPKNSSSGYKAKPYLGKDGRPLPLSERFSESELASFGKEYIATLEQRDADYIKVNCTPGRKVEVKPEHKEDDASIHSNWENKQMLSPYSWICQKMNSDSCGTEISTPIVTSREEIRKYYLEFMAFVRMHNLTTDIDEAICGLGGCHIHFSIVQFSEIEKHFFLKNVAIFMTNYPELNWGFNDVNDNENANSLLSIPIYSSFSLNNAGGCYFEINQKDGKEKKSKPVPVPETQSEHKTDSGEIIMQLKKDTDGRFYNEVISGPNKGQKNYLPTKPVISYEDRRQELEKNRGKLTYKYRKDKNIFRAFVNHPLEVNLNKQYCFRYNSNYNTLEFRIFDMPTTLSRLMLHYDVAMSIYKLCADYAKQGKVLKHTYKKYDYDLEKSLIRFDECLTFLGVNPARAEEMRDNIRVRYEWSENKEKNYLL